MPETPAQTARRRERERRSFTVEGTRDIARAQESALRQGFARGTEPAPPLRRMAEPQPQAPPAVPPPAATARELGGAEDDPNLEITVGPTGEITRRRRQ